MAQNAIYCFVSSSRDATKRLEGPSSIPFTQTHLSTLALSCHFPGGLAEMKHLPVVCQSQARRPGGKGLQ